MGAEAEKGRYGTRMPPSQHLNLKQGALMREHLKTRAATGGSESGASPRQRPFSQGASTRPCTTHAGEGVSGTGHMPPGATIPIWRAPTQENGHSNDMPMPNLHLTLPTSDSRPPALLSRKGFLTSPQTLSLLLARFPQPRNRPHQLVVAQAEGPKSLARVVGH